MDNSIFTPYLSVFKGFSEMFGAAKKGKKEARPKKKTKTEMMKISLARTKAEDATKRVTWSMYHHFKKHHSMLNW